MRLFQRWNTNQTPVRLNQTKLEAMAMPLENPTKIKDPQLGFIVGGLNDSSPATF